MQDEDKRKTTEPLTPSKSPVAVNNLCTIKSDLLKPSEPQHTKNVQINNLNLENNVNDPTKQVGSNTGYITEDEMYASFLDQFVDSYLHNGEDDVDMGSSVEDLFHNGQNNSYQKLEGSHWYQQSISTIATCYMYGKFRTIGKAEGIAIATYAKFNGVSGNFGCLISKREKSLCNEKSVTVANIEHYIRCYYQHQEDSTSCVSVKETEVTPDPGVGEEGAYQTNDNEPEANEEDVVDSGTPKVGDREQELEDELRNCCTSRVASMHEIEIGDRYKHESRGSLQVNQAINGDGANGSIAEEPASADDTEAKVVIDHDAEGHRLPTIAQVLSDDEDSHNKHSLHEESGDNEEI